tara:strand:+ start:104 stop:331 length:228 start_codon:yes stop_codon:yes gene_type:complete
MELLDLHLVDGLLVVVAVEPGVTLLVMVVLVVVARVVNLVQLMEHLELLTLVVEEVALVIHLGVVLVQVVQVSLL